MKPLLTEFRHNGFTFEQLIREGDVALFRKSKPRQHSVHFEVVVIQRRAAGVFKRKPCPAREVMPPSESWGRLGWSYPDRDRAEARFRKVSDRLRNATKNPNTPLAVASLSVAAVRTQGNRLETKHQPH